MRIKINNLLRAILFLLVLYNGIIVSFLKLFNVNVGLSPINIFIILLLPITLLYFTTHKIESKYEFNFKILIFLFCWYIIFKFLYLAINNYRVTSTDALTYILYLLGPLASYYFLSSNSNDKIIKYLRNSFYIIGAIYVIQYLFHNALPSAFTEIPNLFNEIGVEKYSRELEEIIIYRPNGLIGNPITLGFFFNLLLSLELFYWNLEKKKITVLKIIILAVMILLLFSRANIVFAFSIISFNYIFTHRVKKTLLFILITTSLLFLLTTYMYQTNEYVAFMIDRFSGQDQYAYASTQEHLKDYKTAIEVFKQYPIFGITPQENLDLNIITDGAIIVLLLSLGSAGMFFLSIIYLYLFSTVWKKWRQFKTLTPLLFFLIILIPVSILNSAILNKGLYIITFISFILFIHLSQCYAPIKSE